MWNSCDFLLYIPNVISITETHETLGVSSTDRTVPSTISTPSDSSPKYLIEVVEGSVPDTPTSRGKTGKQRFWRRFHTRWTRHNTWEDRIAQKNIRTIICQYDSRWNTPNTQRRVKIYTTLIHRQRKFWLKGYDSRNKGLKSTRFTKNGNRFKKKNWGLTFRVRMKRSVTYVTNEASQTFFLYPIVEHLHLTFPSQVDSRFIKERSLDNRKYPYSNIKNENL